MTTLQSSQAMPDVSARPRTARVPLIQIKPRPIESIRIVDSPVQPAMLDHLTLPIIGVLCGAIIAYAFSFLLGPSWWLVLAPVLALVIASWPKMVD